MPATLPPPAPTAGPFETLNAPSDAGVDDAALDDDVALLLGVLGHRDDAPERGVRIYEQLRRMAAAHRFRYFGTPSMCTTALVHEAYLKLAQSSMDFRSRSHFMMTLSRAMRQVLLTYAEARCAQKRGGGQRPLSLDETSVVVVTDDEAAEIAGIGEALERLEKVDERGARVVECRFFAGLTVDETAATLGVSPATVTRSWREVRVWLYRELAADIGLAEA
jgi:RNA polymerase sigma factor (TIGR02999 family)